MYTAGIVLSLPLPTLAKPALALKQMTLVPYANSCMCLRKGVHVTILDATLGYSSFTATPLQRPAPFFFSFRPPFLFTGFRTSPPVRSMHAS